VRHAQPKHITVNFAETAMWLDLVVRDDGQGMAANAPAGFGLRGMQERVEGLGGRLRLDSAPGRGVSVNICLPLIEGAERPAGEARTGDDA